MWKKKERKKKMRRREKCEKEKKKEEDADERDGEGKHHRFYFRVNYSLAWEDIELRGFLPLMCDLPLSFAELLGHVDVMLCTL